MPSIREVSLQRFPRYAGAVLAILSPSWLAAQDVPGSRTSPAAPGSAHERLAVFEGTWIKVGSQPGQTSTDICGWLPGARRHLICRRVSESGDRASEQLIVYSYRRGDSTFVATVFLAGGQVWEYAGRPEDERWVLYRQRTRPDAPQRFRQVIRVVGDTLHFMEEASAGAGPWQLTDPSEDYKYVKARRPQ